MSAVAFIDSSAFRWADPYYSLVPWQVVAPEREIAVSTRVRIPRIALLLLLQRMASRLGRGGSAVIVAHGTDLGLAMPLVRGGRMSSDIRAIDLLNGMRPASEVAPLLHLRESQVRELRQAASRVRALRTERVELRACNLGNNRASLQSLKRLLGAGTLGAPDVLNAFGKLEMGAPNGDPRYWTRWQQRYPDARIYDLGRDERVGIAPETHELRRGQVHTLASSNAAMREWVQRYLARRRRLGSGRLGREIPYHAAWQHSEPFPMIWPADADYASHIVHV